MEDALNQFTDKQKEQIEKFKNNFNNANNSLYENKANTNLEFPFYFPLILMGTMFSEINKPEKETIAS